ncbi:MAG: hypothetical protein R3A45_08620 [Bdellovibrionota bacterium]
MDHNAKNHDPVTWPRIPLSTSEKLIGTLLIAIKFIATAGAYVGLADLGISGYFMIERTVEFQHYKSSMLSGSGNYYASMEAYDRMVDARIATAIAAGGLVFEAGPMRVFANAQKAKHVGKNADEILETGAKYFDNLVTALKPNEIKLKNSATWKQISPDERIKFLFKNSWDDVEFGENIVFRADTRYLGDLPDGFVGHSDFGGIASGEVFVSRDPKTAVLWAEEQFHVYIIDISGLDIVRSLIDDLTFSNIPRENIIGVTYASGGVL